MDKHLKLKEIVYLIHDVKFEMCPTLFLMNFHSFFSTVKLQLRHSFSQFTFSFKVIFLSVGPRLYF